MEWPPSIHDKCKAISLTDSGGTKGCELWKIPHFLENPLTVSNEVVSLVAPTALCSQEDSWCSTPGQWSSCKD
jgi:hypothetical protein